MLSCELVHFNMIFNFIENFTLNSWIPFIKNMILNAISWTAQIFVINVLFIAMLRNKTLLTKLIYNDPTICFVIFILECTLNFNQPQFQSTQNFKVHMQKLLSLFLTTHKYKFWIISRPIYFFFFDLFCLHLMNKNC